MIRFSKYLTIVLCGCVGTRALAQSPTPTQPPAYHRQSGWLENQSSLPTGAVLRGTDSFRATFGGLEGAQCAGTLTCACLDASADATDGGSLVLREGADDGVNTWTLKVPDSGLTGNSSITLTTTGEIPASRIAHSGVVGRVVCIKADATLGYCNDQPGAGGSCTCL